MRAKYVGIGAGVVILAATSVGIGINPILRPKTQGPPLAVPPELVFPHLSTQKVFDASTQRNYVTAHGVNKTVTIRRSERQSAQSQWSEQSQELSASFFVIDSRSKCDINMYVAGVYDDGDNVVEKWHFIHPPKLDSGGNYVSIASRPLPEVRRSVIYRGSSIGGHIRSIEIEADERFLLILTHENHCLYKLPLPTGAATLLHSPATLPALNTMRSIFYAEHSLEGRRYVLHWHPRHEVASTLTKVPFAVFLNDADKDGAFESIATIQDAAAWNVAEYWNLANWTLYSQLPCP